MTDANRTSADLDPRRRRILFRSWRRGIREMDLILGRFANAHIATLTLDELDLYEALMEVPDHDLFGWISGTASVPQNYDTPLFQRVKSLHGMNTEMATDIK